MTKERLNYLIDIADECSRKTGCVASVMHSIDEDNVFVSMLPNEEYHSFTTYRLHANRYNSTKDDGDLTKAEAFMRMLIKQAEFKEESA